MFMFRDTKSDGTGVFETCGMVTEKGQWTPKPSYYYIAALRQQLTGMRFAEVVPSGNADVWIYRFKGAGGKSAYAVWCPTSDNRKVSGFTLPLTGKSATQIEFASGSVTGKAKPLCCAER